MKKSIYLFTFLFLSTFLALSQIKMVANGDVEVGQNYGQPPYKDFDVRGLAFISHVPPTLTSGYTYSGVWFDIYTNGSYEDPVMEPQWGNTYWVGKPSAQMWRVYANQFYANGVLITSDARYKTNLKPVISSLNRVLSLQPFTYDLKFTLDPKVSDIINKRTEDAGKNQIGFKAQDLLVDFPNLVVYDKDVDKYSVNYIGFIPELVAALKEQNTVIENLRNELELVQINCCKQNIEFNNSTTIEKNLLLGNENPGQSKLYQNRPNPFTEETIIEYFLPIGSNSAILYVYDMNGKQLEKFELFDKGKQQLKIQKNKLTAGIYFYALLVDGIEVATKKMILTD